MLTHGCDVSHWEGLIDWVEAARWLPFVYYKCTDGAKGIDNTFKRNKEGCQASGMAHATYHYFQPEQDPVMQADHYVDTAGEGYGRYIVDFEQRPVRAGASREPKPMNFVVPSPASSLSGKLLAFLQQVSRRTGIKPAIYTSAGFWNENVQPVPAWTKEYDLIVAHYTAGHVPTLPIGWDRYVIWQYTDTFYFPGCECAADGDWFTGDLTQCRAWFGNYQQVDRPPAAIQLKSLFDDLHVRREPKTCAKEVSHLAKGEVIEAQNFSGQDVWVKHARGWSAVEIDGYRYMEVVK
jgi:lysozyme